jgi:hypothetical protein
VADYSFGFGNVGSSGRPRNPYAFGFSSSPSRGGRRYTETQMRSLLKAQESKKKRGLLSDVLHKGGGGLSFVLRQLSRTSHGMAEGVRRGLEGDKKGFTGMEVLDPGEFFKGFSRGFQLKKKTTFSDVLKQEGKLKGHGRLRAVSGFGLDVITDPLLPVSIGTKPIMVGSKAAASLKAAEEVRNVAAISKKSFAERRQILDDAENILKDAGPDFQRHRALASFSKERLAAEEAGDLHRNTYTNDYWGVLRANAIREHKALPRTITIGYAGRRGAGVAVPLKLGSKYINAPSVARTAEGKGVIGKIPGAAKGAVLFGKTFKHGFQDEEVQKTALAIARVKEIREDEYARHAMASFSRFEKMKPDEQLDVLAWAEEIGPKIGLLKGNRVLDEKVLEEQVAKGVLKPIEADFIKAHHNHFEFLRAKDSEYGVVYDKELPKNKIYVPHVYTREGGKVQQGHFAGTPFANARVHEEGSIKDIIELRRNGMADDFKIETDPMKLAAIRTRKAAHAHASRVEEDFIANQFGIPDKVFAGSKYETQLARIRERADEFRKKHEKEWGHNPYAILGKRSGIVRRGRKRASERVDKFNARLFPERQAITKELDNLKEQYQAGAMPEEVYRAGVARLEARRDELEDAMERFAVRQYDDRIKQDLVKFEDDLYTKNTNESKRIAGRVQRINELEARAEKIALQGVKNPNIPPGYVKWERPHLKQAVWIPKEMKDSLGRMETALHSPDSFNAEFARNFAKLTGWWKLAVTAVNPGYRVRNTMSDSWNMYLSGVPMARQLQYGAQAVRIWKHSESALHKLAKNPRAKLSDKEVEAFARMSEAYSQGVLSGLFQGDVVKIASMFKDGRRARSFLKKGNVPMWYIKGMTDFNRHAENIGRMTHYLYRRDVEGLGPTDAAEWVKKAHFDYEELTPFERDKLRAFIPFYTWSRKNIPFQFQRMVQRPGKMATATKLYQTMNELGTGDPRTPMVQENTLPSWMREGYAAQIGKASVLMPAIGLVDVSRVEHPMNFLKQGLNPFLKAGYELTTGKSMLTGADWRGGDRRRPVSGFAAGLLGAIPGNPMDVGTTGANVHGEYVHGAGASPWVAYGAGQIPILNAIVNQASSIKRRQKGNWMRTAGGILGINTYERDLEKERVIAELEFRDLMLQDNRDARAEGRMPPVSKKKKSKYQTELDKLITGGGSG